MLPDVSPTLRGKRTGAEASSFLKAFVCHPCTTPRVARVLEAELMLRGHYGHCFRARTRGLQVFKQMFTVLPLLVESCKAVFSATDFAPEIQL